ncbi:hypothetical protein ACOMHN_058709 [Nucella lapillus]
MRAGQRAQGKQSTRGASLARGARQHHQHQDGTGGVLVKQEAEESVGEGVWRQQEEQQQHSSRQLLRKSIMDRRQAQGLRQIPAAAVSATPVYHQLTPEEEEKKERRKEQNRRAAKKCRMKKKRHQSDIEIDFTKMVEDKEKLELEKIMLQAKVDSLRKELNEHVQSGQCRLVQLDIPCPVTASSPVTSTPSSLPEAVYTPPMEYLQTAQVEQYLSGFEELSPEQTFNDMDIFDLTHRFSAEELGIANIPPSDSNDTLKTLAPERPAHVTCLSNPTSPTLHGRHSVSSVASDWSDLSQGFGQVPTQGGSPAPVRCNLGRSFLTGSLTSTGEWEGEVNSPQDGFCQQGMALGVPMDCDPIDLEDDVFPERSYVL